MIELALLGLLREQDLHGYELKKRLGELLGPWSTMSFGSLYPALARLEAAGLVEAVEEDDVAPADAPDAAPEPAAPMTGALSGELAAFRQRLQKGTGTAARATKPRATKAATKTAGKAAGRGRRGKKVYRLTEAGQARLTELLLDPGPDDERTFALRVAFCRHLEPAQRLVIFERRKAELTRLLAARRTAERRGDLYLRSLRDREARALAADLAWLDELVVATREDEALPTDDTPRSTTRHHTPAPSLHHVTSPRGTDLAHPRPRVHHPESR